MSTTLFPSKTAESTSSSTGHPSPSPSSLPHTQVSSQVSPADLAMSSSTKQTSHDLTAQPGSTETSQSYIDTTIPPEYTRKLIPMIGIPADEVDENFDEAAWFKKLYPNVIVLQTVGVPRGWILVADPKKPGKKVKKWWNKFDDDDPNCSINNARAQYGLPPIDKWNIGVEYTYNEDDLW